MEWEIPPRIKVYEAFGCLSDKRMDIDGNQAKIYSSSRGKYYTVTFDPESNAIMSNDNGSYWKNYLGYPAIAFLMQIGKLKRYPLYESALGDIPWKDINTEFKNDFSKTEQHIHNILSNKKIPLETFQKDVDDILKNIENLHLKFLGKKVQPPKGY